MELLMEADPMFFWNVLITLIFAPLLYNIRANTGEIKRIDILLNKTREEIPTKYVTKNEMKEDFERLLDRFDRLEEKLDKILQA
jgi:hypothetical protein|tara:strand:- start:5419 stop:5670 length:252 start_codon:yes stop_codon:yes gene_type:complete